MKAKAKDKKVNIAVAAKATNPFLSKLMWTSLRKLITIKRNKNYSVTAS
jgi:hypothetical protein